tara:strand:+ start:2203 stop:2526 length:324 start_codon:yes stop_codon:yes gene_type:complete
MKTFSQIMTPQTHKVRYYFGLSTVKHAAAAKELAGNAKVHSHSLNTIKGFCEALGVKASTFNEAGLAVLSISTDGAVSEVAAEYDATTDPNSNHYTGSTLGFPQDGI